MLSLPLFRLARIVLKQFVRDCPTVCVNHGCDLVSVSHTYDVRGQRNSQAVCGYWPCWRHRGLTREELVTTVPGPSQDR